MRRVLPRQFLRPLLIAVILELSSAADAQASGWQRTQWSLVDGAPSSVSAVARTPDGFLWLGTWTGLYRFDGVGFKRMVREPGSYPKSDAVLDLLVASNGDLWVGHDWGGASVVRDGRYLPVGQQIAGSTVRQIVEAPDGTINALVGYRSVAVWRLRIDRWDVTTLEGTPASEIYGAKYDRHGALWFITDRRLWVLPPGGSTARMLAPLPAGSSTLASAKDGLVWLVLPDGMHSLPMQHATGGLDRGAIVPFGPVQGRQQIIFDEGRGFWRLSRERGVERYDFTSRGGAIFSRSFPVETRAMLAIQPNAGEFDSEGILWVGGENGIDQYRRVPFHSFGTSGGKPSGRYGEFMVLRDGAGDVYLRRASQLLKVVEEGPPQLVTDRVLMGDMPCPSPQGGIWLRDGHGHFVLRGGKAHRQFDAPAVLKPEDHVAGCAEDRSGRLWFSSDQAGLAIIGRPGVSHVDLGPDRGFSVTAFGTGPSGNVVAYVGAGFLWRQVSDSVEALWKEASAQIGFLEFIYSSERLLYFGGPKGLTRYDGARFVTLSNREYPFLTFLSGMVRTRRGETWLLNADGVVRLSSADLDRAFSTPGTLLDFTLLEPRDGLPGKAPYNNNSNLVEDRWGRVWIASNNGIASIDPHEIPRNLTPPPVRIFAISSGSRRLDPGAHLAFPAGTTRISIHYAGLSLAMPARNQHRYRLSGVDSEWVNAGAMREAVYTRLGPGAYRFDVVASNDDGVWSPHSASVDFEILPAFYQTSWFLAACLILGVALLYSLVRLRMWQITKRIREGLEERVAERERISREIHDTLLQSVQGLTLTVHSALDRIPATHSEGRAPLESVLDRADRTITEARQRIAGLRTQGPGAGLAQTIEETVRTSALQHIQPRLNIHRGERRIHALVLAELSSILREALNNIAWHANAKVVEIVVSVRDNGLELVVADDGVGIPAEILAKGFKEGHFGLIGMRERAERCGGELLFARGKNGCGTRITFSIPGHAAFEEVTKPSLRKELLRVLKVVTPGRRRHGGR